MNQKNIYIYEKKRMNMTKKKKNQMKYRQKPMQEIKY